MNPDKFERTQSSLLIPEKYMDEFNRRTKIFSREEYFHALLERYRNVLLWKTFDKLDCVKTKYQEEGQSLQKKNFRPENADWIELGEFAQWLGISRTALFTLLLLLDLAGWDIIIPDRFYDVAVPPKISSIAVGVYLSKRKTTRYNRLIRHKMR
ncbi:MAG: DUF1564 domain-containing protein [Leptospiraceae bacterium]|nr:DUF1564 family protein [Leptospiraceae bacterium]MCK6380698.1 DUF1564 domain-containing protein [Leptospiraceae bacterium]NUM42040.1 DUF1564 family protein [Leptospiraceae bacterium]